MKVIDIINGAKARGETLFTVEMLPPLKGEGTEGIFEAIEAIMPYGPSYINITFHREEVTFVERQGGMFDRRVIRRRPGTVGISSAIRQRYGVEVVPHLICGGLSKYDIEDALIDLDFLGIENVLALRGDNLKGETRFIPHPYGHGFANELVDQIRDMNRGIFVDNEIDVSHHSAFCIGVAAYPEKHSDASNIETDIKNLKRKVDAGADYIVTQMCFDNGSILNFIAACRRFGIEVPIAVGIKPLSSRSHLTLLPQVFGVSLPEELVAAVGECRDNEAVKQVGAEWAIEQGRALKRAGIPVLHFYTMGRSDRYMQMIAKALF